MFTGIIEEIGSIKSITKNSRTILICVNCSKILSDVKLGDSVAVNGICLTVCKHDSHSFVADVMPETVLKTSLSSLFVGSLVNLERAVPINGRFGGHIVSGHIDGIGNVKKISEDENAVWFEISAPENIMKYIVIKGSVCIDGTSLTVADVSKNAFKVSLIPHTRKMSVLANRKINDTVNIECDILGKYIEKFMFNKEDYEKEQIESEVNSNKKDISVEFLSENGYF